MIAAGKVAPGTAKNSFVELFKSKYLDSSVLPFKSTKLRSFHVEGLVWRFCDLRGPGEGFITVGKGVCQGSEARYQPWHLVECVQCLHVR